MTPIDRSIATLVDTASVGGRKLDAAAPFATEANSAKWSDRFKKSIARVSSRDKPL
jgi:hypothetical protein